MDSEGEPTKSLYDGETKESDLKSPIFLPGPCRSATEKRHSYHLPEHFSSLPFDYLPQCEDDVEKTVNLHQQNNEKLHFGPWEAEDTLEYINALDESCILDIESLENLNWSESLHERGCNRHMNGDRRTDSNQFLASNNNNVMLLSPIIDQSFVAITNTTMSTSSSSPLCMTTSSGPVEKYPKIMTMSCYGTLTKESIGVNVVDNIFKASTLSTISLQDDDYCHSTAMTTLNGVESQSMCGSITGTIISSLQNSFYDDTKSGTISTANIELLPNNVEDSVQRHAMYNGVGSWCRTSMEGKEIASYDLQAIQRLLDNENGNQCCPSCHMPFDKGKKRKLIDTCGHARCYLCMFKNEQCPICVRQQNNEITNKDCDELNATLIKSSYERVNSGGGVVSTSGGGTGIGGGGGGGGALVESSGGSCSALSMVSSPKVHHRSSVTVNQSTKQLQQQLPQSPLCVTPQTHRRRLFHPKNLRSPFSAKRTSAANPFGSLEQPACSDDDGATSKTHLLGEKTKATDAELQVRLGFFLDNNARHGSGVGAHPQSYGVLQSTNTSPVSTLTGSSEADFSRIHYQSAVSESIGSLMSVSVSGHSNRSASPAGSRNLASAEQQGNLNELLIAKSRKSLLRRSGRSDVEKRPTAQQNESSRVPQLTLKPLFFEVPSQEPEPLFIGRQWLLREISNALSLTESRGILLSGSPGTGKTSFLLHLVEHSCFGSRRYGPLTSPETDGIYCQANLGQDRMRSLASHVVAYHFCQADNNATCFVPDFIHSLAAQLCQAPQLAAYREHLLSEMELQHILSIRECIADPERAITLGILEPLALLRKQGKISTKNCLILIDGLCEAEYHRPDHGSTIASFLAKVNEHFPTWLKLIVTVRSQMIEFVKGLPYTKMTFDKWGASDALHKDMLDYITFRTSRSPAIQNNVSTPLTGKDGSAGNQKFAQYLVNLTNGSFLFAKLVLDLIERGHLVVKSSSYKVLPVSLAQVYLLHFNLKFPTHAAYEKIADILNVCLAALFPLTLIEIFYSVNALTTEPITWDEFMVRFKILGGLLVERIDNTFMYFHPSFREWLTRRDEGESTKFLCDLRAGHAAIAFRLSRLQAPLDDEQTLELGHHILKAHLYRNAPQYYSARDLQAYWIATASKCSSAALCCLRNVYNPNIKVSRLLLLAGASADYVTAFLGNATMLCIAAHEGIVPMVSLLLEFGASVHNTNSQGYTPLIVAARRGHCDVVRQLVAAGSSIGQLDTAQRCALVHAARAGQLNVVKYLVACDWIQRVASDDVELVEAAQQALVAAAAQGHTAIVEELLEMAEVEVNKMDNLGGDSALTMAALNGYSETVSALLLRGATPDKRNRKELTPLLLAVKEGHWAIVEHLLQNNASIEESSMCGKTPLIVAAEEGHVGIIELLVNKGASLTATDNEGLSALSWACLRGRLQAVKCLLEHEADCNQADQTGRAPLDLAAYQGTPALVQMLLEKGAKLEHVDENGMRPLDRAIASKNLQVVQAFLKRGAKLGPTTWAMASGKADILLLLLNKLLEDGNILYRKNRLQEASYRYQYALKKLTVIGQSSMAHMTAFNQLRVNFLLNHSRCRRKMNDIIEAIELATEAIVLKPESYEGYYARAKAHFDNGSYLAAQTDNGLALKYAEHALPDIKSVFVRMHDEIKFRLEQGDATTEL